jgi:integrase
MRCTSYHQGSLKLAERRKGKVCEFRWREVQIDGSIRRKNIVIGSLEEFPNESTAQAAVDALRLEINQQTPQQLIKSISLETLVNHYRQYELPDIFNKTKPGPDTADEDRKSYATQVTYEGYLKKWILPRWGAYRLTEVRAVEVEKWLKTLCFKKTGIALARGSKAKIRNIMSALYSHAIRWEWADKNPITSVRQSAKREKTPDVLTAEEIVAILAELPNPLRTMIERDAFTGLRRGELIGLRWEDVDFEQLILHVRRSVVAMVEGAPKTEASQKDVPLDAQTAESLFAWRQTCAYPASHDWVFASPAMHGKQPYWPGTQWR